MSSKLGLAPKEKRPMPSGQRGPLTLPEYERLFRTIHAIIANEDGDPSKSCLFFGIAGAFLLNRSHGLKTARPVMGVAGYNLRTPSNLVLLLGKPELGSFVADPDAFHCWIDIDGWTVDLAAPLFDEMAPIERKDGPIKPFMFQKPSSGSARAPNELNAPGAYLHVADLHLTNSLLSHFSSMQAHSDLITICAQWYTRPPKKMALSVAVGNQHGAVTEVQLSNMRVEGAW